MSVIPKNILGREIKKGVSILAASMNRNEQLEQSLPTWLATSADEIIIVDWSSIVPVENIIKKYNDPRINVIRVSDKKYWVLTLAVNLAARCTSRNNILKLDSDSKISADFLEKHPLTNNIFYAGNWQKARNKNEQHTNGIIYVKRRNFFNVMGYNEYIQTYGWDDCDLYERLCKFGLRRFCIDFESVYHIQHDNEMRTSNQRAQRLDVEIEKNRLLAGELKWIGPMLPILSISKYMDNNDNIFDCKLSSVIPTPSVELLEKILAQALVNRNITKKYNLFIEVRNGLGNRLRSLASAFNIAVGSNRNLVLIWETNEHCEATVADLYDLFKLTGLVDRNNILFQLIEDKRNANLPPITTFIKESENVSVYDYMQESEKNKYIDDTVNNDIYIISACSLVNHYTTWQKECDFLKSMVPSITVENQVNNFVKILAEKKIKIEDCIGVHIRMSQPGKSYENTSDYTEIAKQSIDKWRAASNWNIFLKEIKSILRSNPSQKFFLCCDNETAYEELLKRLPDVFVFTKKVVFDRSVEQVQNALVDLILLSKTKEILGSNWSTFTEIANRLGGKKIRFAGKDF